MAGLPMTVEELIEELQRQPKFVPVEIETPERERGYGSYHDRPRNVAYGRVDGVRYEGSVVVIVAGQRK